MYGVDYRWTTQQGVLSNQLLLRNQTNGYDPVEAYGILYFPRWGQGTVMQIGRYISPPDIEAQLAPNNFLYTHSLMFDFDCYTQTGILIQTKLSNYWTLEYGIHAGNDIAPWDGSQHFPTGLLIARWVSHSNRDSVLFGIDSLSLGSHNGQNFTTYTKGTYVNASTGQVLPLVWGHDNLQQQNVTWTHVFNPGFQNQFEAYYLYQYNAYVGGRSTTTTSPPVDRCTSARAVVRERSCRGYRAQPASLTTSNTNSRNVISFRSARTTSTTHAASAPVLPVLTAA